MQWWQYNLCSSKNTYFFYDLSAFVDVSQILLCYWTCAVDSCHENHLRDSCNIGRQHTDKNSLTHFIVNPSSVVDFYSLYKDLDITFIGVYTLLITLSVSMLRFLPIQWILWLQIVNDLFIWILNCNHLNLYVRYV